MRFMHDSPQLPVAGSHWHGCVVPYMRTRDTKRLRLIVWKNAGFARIRIRAHRCSCVSSRRRGSANSRRAVSTPLGGTGISNVLVLGSTATASNDSGVPEARGAGACVAGSKRIAAKNEAQRRSGDRAGASVTLNPAALRHYASSSSPVGPLERRRCMAVRSLLS